MKHTLFLFLLMLACNLYAQDGKENYIISEINGGSVLKLDGKNKIEVKEGDRISGLDKLLISEGATMILLEPKPCNRCTVKGSYTGTIPNYKQRNQNSCVMTITEKYMNYLLSQIGHKKHASGDNSTTATVYRGSHRKKATSDDSILMPVKSIDTLYHIIDSLSPTVPDTIITPTTGSN